MIALLCVGAAEISLGQENDASQICAKQRIRDHQIWAKTTVADPAEDSYDVTYVRLNIKANNLSVGLAGDVITQAKVVAGSMPSYVFELNNQYIIDSVLVNGQNFPVTHNGDVHTATLANPLLQNAAFTAQVFYHGAINPGTAFYSTGIRNQSSPTWGNSVTYTMSEPYESKDWWPVKQSLTDKIDSADIWIVVPSGLKAGSNGILTGINVMPNSDWRYEWKSRYPIDYYLLSFSVASYVDYSFYTHLPNSTDSVLVQNYVYDNPQTLPYFKNRIDSIGLMIQYLSQLFGKYPFWQEKYGHCMAPLSGGMEHQTMTTLGNFGTTLSVHELGHQWFGDNVTCQTWKDIWLNEGFASYTEYLYVEHFWSPAAAYLYMFDKHNKVLMDTAGSVYVDDTTDENRIFDDRLTYDKGASIVHTLRFVFNNDSLFFAALQNYQQQYAHQTATTEDFKNSVAQTLGQNLDTFFNQWIYGEGHPIYSAHWNQVGNWVFVQLDQTTSHPSVTAYNTPLEFQFFSPQGDTIVRVQSSQLSQNFSFYWGRPMSGMTIDPNDWILNAFGSITQDPTLGVDQITNVHRATVTPNPTKGNWLIKNMGEDCVWQLTDVNGKMLGTGTASGEATIPADQLPSGFYLLRIRQGKAVENIKLIKQ